MAKLNRTDDRRKILLDRYATRSEIDQPTLQCVEFFCGFLDRLHGTTESKINMKFYRDSVVSNMIGG